MTIIESGLKFVFDDADCFHIEKDDVMKREGVKTCECVAVTTHERRYTFIEAKSSAPRAETEEQKRILGNLPAIPDNWRILTNFDCFIEDICQKFENSFSALMAIQRGCHGPEAAKRLPANVKELKNDNVVFVLAMGNNFQEDWLVPLVDALRYRLRPFLNSWNIPDAKVKVVNCALGQQLGIPMDIVA